MKTGFFPVRIYYTGKTLFWPCTGPVRDCSVYFKPSRKNKDFVFLPVSILPGWLKILHLMQKSNYVYTYAIQSAYL